MADGTEGFSDTGDDTGTGETDETPLIKQLRAELKSRDKRIAETQSAQRELAFLKAGIDTSTKLGTLFVKSFDGDLDPEKIKAEAVELGLLAAPEVPDPERPTDTSSTERSNLASGATGDDGSGVDPRETARSRADAALKQGATFEAAAGGFINELARAALSGDQRVVIKGKAF